MTDLYLFYINGEKYEELLKEKYPLLPRIIKEKIDKTKDEKTKIERLFSYSYLFDLLLKKGVSKEEQNLNFSFGEHGKPYLKNNSLNFSLSHSEDIVAIAVAKDKKVGVDVEFIDIKKEKSIEKILSRFLSDVDLKNIKIAQNVNINLNFDTEKIKNVKNNEEKSLYTDFFKWTHLEALLKCDGGGFCSVSNKSDILKKTEVISYAFELKNKSFAVSLVKEI